MSLPISVYRAGRFTRYLKLSKAKNKVLSGRYRWRDDGAAIEEVEARLVRLPSQVFINGPFGVGNMVPFARVPSKLRQPQKLHYAIPACGAHGRLLVVANVNFEPAGVL